MIGAKGRMGLSIAKLIEEDASLKLAAGIDVGDTLADKIDNADALIDFSRPAATVEAVEMAANKNKAVVIGTTGFSDDELLKIKMCSDRIPILLSSNMSRGVNTMFEVLKKTLTLLGTEYNIDIIEKHHIHKKDKPSGTAKSLLDIIHSQKREAHVDAIREGEIIGEHEVKFSSTQETLTISHVAHDRDIFAKGAIKAAKWLIGQKPGLYSMIDFLNSHHEK
ncbi:MAG: dihydrodipicolinate reductase C-terminal domain-containing protein [Pseudomonadota bacterium]